MLSLDQLTVRDAMIKDVFTLSPEQDVIDAVKHMVQRRITGAPVRILAATLSAWVQRH